jgi:hypothetical protein
MKQLEKEGKVPEGYYARRRITYTGGGISIFLILFLLYRFGIFSFLLPIVHTVNNTAKNSVQNQGTLSVPDYALINKYINSCSKIDDLYNSLYEDCYSNIYLQNDIPTSKFEEYSKKFEKLRKEIKTDKEVLKKFETNYNLSITICEDIISFVSGKDDFSEADVAHFEYLAISYHNLLGEIYSSYSGFDI